MLRLTSVGYRVLSRGLDRSADTSIKSSINLKVGIMLGVIRKIKSPIVLQIIYIASDACGQRHRSHNNCKLIRCDTSCVHGMEDERHDRAKTSRIYTHTIHTYRFLLGGGVKSQKVIVKCSGYSVERTSPKTTNKLRQDDAGWVRGYGRSTRYLLISLVNYRPCAGCTAGIKEPT